MNKALLYLRVSSNEQVDNTSLEVQEQSCREWCRRKEIRVFNVMKLEGVTAKSTNEERVQELIAFCKENKEKFDHIVVFKLSRFARSVRHHQNIRWKLMKMGIKLRSATEQIDETPIGQLTENQLSSFYQFDNDIRKENSINGMSKRIKDGLWPWLPTVGYYLPKTEGIRLSVAGIDELCYRDVIDLFELYSTGNYSFKKLSSIVYQKKIKNQRGTKDLYFGINGIRRILKNKFYIGILVNPFDGKEYDGKHETFIPLKLWIKCQGVMNGRSKENSTRLKENINFPLKGFMKHDCGERYASSQTRGNGGKYNYYMCKKCRAPSFKAEDVHAEFSNLLRQMTPKENRTKMFFIELAGILQESVELHNIQEKKLARELKRLNTRQERLEEGFLDGLIDKDRVIQERSKIKLEVKSATNDLQKIDKVKVDYKDVMNKAEQFIINFPEKWENGDLTDRKLIQGSLFPEGLEYSGKFKRTFSSPQVFEAISSGYRPKKTLCDPRGNRTLISTLKG